MNNEVQPNKPIEIFYSYSHEDIGLLNELIKHLTLLRREGLIVNWHDRQISPGQEWKGKIDEKLNSADVILLLVSSDFIHSDYCYDKEMHRAIERHEAGEATVIPIIIRECDWKSAPFNMLQVLPQGSKPVTLWAKQDEAFTNIAKGIRKVVSELISRRNHPTGSEAETEVEKLGKSLDAAAETGDYTTWLKLADRASEVYGHRQQEKALALWERGINISEDLKATEPLNAARMHAVSLWRLAAFLQRRSDSRTVPLLKMALGLESDGRTLESESPNHATDLAQTLRMLMPQPQSQSPLRSWLYEVEENLYQEAINLLTLDQPVVLMFLVNLVRIYQIKGADTQVVLVKVEQAIDVADKNIRGLDLGSIELLVQASAWLSQLGKTVDLGRIKAILEQRVPNLENTHVDSEETAHLLYLLSRVCGDKKRAQSLLQKALQIADTCPVENILMAKILLHLGRFSDDPDNPELAKTYLERALLILNENDSDQAQLIRSIKAQLIITGFLGRQNP